MKPYVARWFAAVSASLAMSSNPVVAQSLSRACGDAEAAFARAHALRFAGHSPDALRELEALSQRCPSPRALVQRALVEDDLDRWPAAYAHLAEALRSTHDAWVAAHLPAIEDARRAVVAHLALLAPQPSEPGTDLWIRGRFVGTLPLREPHVVTPGEVTFELRNGDQSCSVTRTLRAGEELREACELPLVAPSVASPVASTPRPEHDAPHTAPPRPRTRRVAGYVLLGVGAALAAGTAATWTLSYLQSAQATTDPRWRAFYNSLPESSASDPCGAAQSNGPAVDHARQLCADNATTTTLTWAFGLGAVAFVGAGAVLVATSPRSSEEPSPVRVSPILGAGVAGASLTASF